MTYHPQPNGSRAVLIGVTRYAEPERWPSVSQVANNLADLSAVLQDPELWGLPEKRCEVIQDPEDGVAVLERVLAAAKDAEDTLVVYFAGHGHFDGSGLVLPIATSTSENLVFRRIPFAAVREIVAKRKARHAAIILDCCWSGAAITLSDGPAMVDRAADDRSAYLLTSSARDSLSLVLPGEKHTVFTGELLDVLRNGLPSSPMALPLSDVTEAVVERLVRQDMPVPRHSQVGLGDRIALVRNRQWRAAAPTSSSVAANSVAATSSEVDVPDSECVLRPYPERFAPVVSAGALQTPSLLLRADRAIVPFHGRERERQMFARWRDNGGVSVRVLYAGGGQGKTRFARQLAEEWGQEGWSAWHAIRRPKRHLTPPAPVRAMPRAAVAGTLVVVDYADRWPTEDLKRLVEFAASSGAAPVRVLLLARMAGSWWTALTPHLPTVGAAHDAVALSSHTPEPARRPAEFQAAREGYARALGIPLDRVRPKPVEEQPDWELRDFSLVLTVHMAALVDVLALLSGASAPVDPVGVSADLLARERAQWVDVLDQRDFKGLALDQVRTAVYVATLTGGLPVKQARRALGRVGIDSREDVSRLLNLHRQCYPPLDDWGDVALEPLYPDRLGEDFLALTIPGHAVHYPVQLEAQELAEQLLIPHGADSGGPPWTPYAMTMLVETSRRWSHVADTVLYPLLTVHPQLAVRAGGTFLARLAEVLTERTDLLVRIREHLPPERGVDLAVGVAALERRLASHDAEHATSGADLAHQADERVRSYSDAGQSREALAEAARAVDAWRALVEYNQAAHQAGLARALASLGSLWFANGDQDKALACAEEALRLIERTEGLSVEPPERAFILLTVASVLQSYDGEAGVRAVALSKEAAATFRAAGPGPDRRYEAGLADSLAVLCAAYGRAGDYARARAAGDEALAILGRLHGTRTSGFPQLGEVLDMLGRYAAEDGDLGIAVRRGKDAVRIRRLLAAENPAFEDGLATSLSNLAGYYSDQAVRHDDPSQHEAAVAHAEEAVQILRGRAGRSPGTSDVALRAASRVLATVLRRRNGSAR
jgi:tetratricopeptide (TPR) repeat protein